MQSKYEMILKRILRVFFLQLQHKDPGNARSIPRNNGIKEQAAKTKPDIRDANIGLSLVCQDFYGFRKDENRTLKGCYLSRVQRTVTRALPPIVQVNRVRS